MERNFLDLTYVEYVLHASTKRTYRSNFKRADEWHNLAKELLNIVH